MGRFRAWLQQKSVRRKRSNPGNSTLQKADADLPPLPAALWVGNVLPFLDRRSQNRLLATSKDIHETFLQQVQIQQQEWPQGKFRFSKPVIKVAFSPMEPSSFVLAILPANSTTILIWNRRKGYDHTLKGHGGIVSDITFCQQTGTLASCSRTDGTVRLWTDQYRIRDENIDENESDAKSTMEFRCFRQLVLRVFAMRFVRFSPCGDMIATWGHDPMIRLHRIDQPPEQAGVGSTPWKSRLRISCWDCVAFPKQAGPNKTTTILAHTYDNEHVRLWNWATKTTMQLQDAERTVAEGDYESYISSMVMLSVPDIHNNNSAKEYLVVGCRVATVKIWDLTDYSCLRSFRLGGGWSAVTHIVFSGDGSKMACTSQGAQIRIFDFVTGTLMVIIKQHKDRVESLSFTPDGKALASGSCDRTMRLTSVPTLNPFSDQPMVLT